MDTNQSQKLGTLLKFLETGRTGHSPQVYTGLDPDKGTSVMYRVKSSQDGRLAKLLHFVSMFPERAKMRAEIKTLLKANGVEITNDIKKALPNSISLGNSIKLAKQIRASLLSKAGNISGPQGLLSLIKLELYQANWSDKNSTGTFMRGNSASQIGLGNLLTTDQIKAECQSIAKKAVDQGRKQLQGKNLSAGDYDNAMLEIYKTTLQSVCKIKLPDSFTDLAIDMTKLIDQVATEMSGNHDATAVKQISEEMKKLVTASMMLRTYSQALSDSLKTEMEKLHEEITNNDRQAEIPANFTGYDIGQYLMKLFSGKTIKLAEFEGKKTAEQFPKFTGFLADPKTNNLENFSSLKTLQQSITGLKQVATH